MSNASLAAPSSHAPHPITQVWLMEGWRVLQNGLPREIPTGQPRALLTYLLLQPNYAALRSMLVEELWPDVPADRGRRYLSDALYRLRRALDPAPILADAEQIALDMAHAWWCDVWAFYAAATSADLMQRAASIEHFAPTLALEITDHWILVQRVRLQERFVQTALEVAAAAESAHDDARAETAYHRALAIDPLLESAHRGLMRTLARSGQLAAALEHYDKLVDRLEREIVVPPSQETRELADQLFQELDLARRRAETRTIRRLVGRVEERSRLLTALDSARAGRAGLVVLLGEPGIGKTALLRDLAHAADWRGWQIHWGVSQEGVSPAPYAPLTSALHDALPEPRAAQLAASLPPIWHDLLARVLPSLQRPSALPVAAFEPRRLPQALAQLLHTLQEIAPLLLLLDNVQWGDPALWQLLNELTPLLRLQRTLLVLSAQTDALQADPSIWTQLETWDREGMAEIIALDGLSPAALGELATLHHHPLSQETQPPPLTRKQADALHTASGGNPLLTLEILAAGTPHALLESRPAIATLVAQRLHRLSSDARQAAELAAVLGSQVIYHQWEALWQAENPYGGELASSAAELERAEVLQINRSGYTFAHDTLHAAALAEMEPHTRRRRHITALALLEGSEQGQPTDLLRLLYHAQGAENRPAIARYALCAGEQALTAFAFARAEAHFTLALAHLPEMHDPADPSDRTDQPVHQHYTALLGRIQARHIMALRDGQAADIAALCALPLTHSQQTAALTRQAEYQLAIASVDAAQESAQSALAMADRLEPGQAAELHLLMARIARDRSDLQVAQEQLTTARSIYQETGDGWGVAMTTDLLGGLAWDQGVYERAAQMHAQAADAFQTLGDQLHEAQSLNNLGSTYWELGRYADARATHERSILVCRELGNKLGEGDNIDNLGGVAWVLGDYTLALRQYRAALDLRESVNDLWGVAISLSNLASTYRMQGAYAEALDYYQRSLPLYDQTGRKRSRAYVIEGEGLTLLALGRLEEAWARLQDAFALRSEIGDRTHLIEIHAAMLHAALARKDHPQATTHCDSLLALLEPGDRASLRQQAYFAQFSLAAALDESEKAARALALALRAQAEMASALPPADRERFLHNVPLNRDLAQAAQRYCQSETVMLGLGKQVKRVTWSLIEAEDSLIEDETARRRHVMNRLLAQAAAQGVTPTHDQLAASLGVSRRTILRDLAALQNMPEEDRPQTEL
ncbi:MAG: tetratricopeptide repeat protein [Caldilineaceae bacterium]|nr:tetratricopeptide repeat protein [Caldilineaceae bacterium]